MHLCMKAAMYIIMMQLLWCAVMCANEFSFFSWVESMQAAYINTFHKTWFDPTSYNVEMMTGVVVHTGYQGAVQLSNQCNDGDVFGPNFCDPTCACIFCGKNALKCKLLYKTFLLAHLLLELKFDKKKTSEKCGVPPYCIIFHCFGLWKISYTFDNLWNIKSCELNT